MTEHSMEGLWFVTAYNPDGTWSNSFQPHRNANPWMLTKSPYDAPVGYWQRAERSIWYEGFRREVRVRTKTECEWCGGDGNEGRKDPRTDCTDCVGRGWYWKEEPNGS